MRVLPEKSSGIHHPLRKGTVQAVSVSHPPVQVLFVPQVPSTKFNPQAAVPPERHRLRLESPQYVPMVEPLQYELQDPLRLGMHILLVVPQAWLGVHFLSE